MGAKTLEGVNIVVTRARQQAGEFVDLLNIAGANVIYFPTIEFKEPEDLSIIDDAIKNLTRYNWIIFTSANGVRFFFKRFSELSKSTNEFKVIKVGVVGPKTSEALHNVGIRVDLVPKDYRAEGLIKELLKAGVEGNKILIPRALVGRDILPDTLCKFGAQVTVAPIYETISPSGLDTENLMKEIYEGNETILTFTSGSTVINFFNSFDDEQIARMKEKVKVAVISPITADAVMQLGFKVDIIPQVFTAKHLVEAIIESRSKPNA